MTTKISDEKSLRDKYFANEIFRIGELVEDINTGEQMKILDRGSNYVTVATSAGIIKKWLNEVKEEVIVEVVQEEIIPVKDKDFEILESGQIKLFGHETKNFDLELSTLILEQFSEFDDLYSKHQIIKCLDISIQESDTDVAYDLLNKVDKFYSKQNITSPFIVEAMKNDIERTRISQILAAVANVTPTKNNNTKTIKDTIVALKAKYKSRQQWEVLAPFFKVAQDAGLIGVMNNLPFNVASLKVVSEEQSTDELMIEILEDNLDLLVEELSFDDVDDTFLEEDYSDELISEVLSFETRIGMARKIKQHSPMMNIRRERALTKSASSTVLLSRARKLAETLLKRKLFHKSPSEMTRQEKERFEAGATKRRSLVARLAQRLIGKVRDLQSARLHHTATPVSPERNIAGGHIAQAATTITNRGAS